MQGMREMLRSTLGRSLRDLSPADRLLAAWPVACGSALAAHGELEDLDGDGVLHVLVRQREWLETFRTMSKVLASDLSRIAGVKVREIHFENRSSAPPRTIESPDALRVERSKKTDE